MPEKFEQNLNKPPFTEEDAEKLVKAALGEDVFEKPDQETQKPKSLGAATAKKEESRQDYQPYVYKEIDRLGQALVDAKRKSREARSEKEKIHYEERAKFFREELEKAKAVRDKIKQEKLAKEKRGLDKEREAA
jgi:hypothetical protein